MSSAEFSSLLTKRRSKIVSPNVRIMTIFRKLNQYKRWLIKVIQDFKEYKKDEEMNKETIFDLDKDIIDAKDKMVLTLHESYRTNKEIKVIAEKLKFILPFVRYPVEMIEDLVRHANLIGYEKGRILYLPNQESVSAYFILSGVIEAIPEKNNQPILEFQRHVLEKEEFEEMEKTTKQLYTRGHLLGRKKLLFGEDRARTAIVKEDLLCIKFERKYMLDTLKPMLERWVEVFSYLKSFELFYYLDMDTMRELCKIGSIENYGVNKCVNVSDTSYFLIEGEAFVIQRILIQKYLNNGKWSLRLYEDQDATEYGDDVSSVFMQVMVLNKGAYFGLGERMSKHVIWTKRPSKFVQFSSSELFTYGDPSVWEGQRIYLDGLYPTTEQLFKYFLYGRQWLKYKKDLTNQITSNQKRPGTVHNVPIPLRCNHTKLKKSSIKRLGIKNMPDYLKGGIDPADDEIKNKYVLDKKGDLRENLFGKYRTDPNREEVVKKEEKKKTELDSFPSFFFYNVLKEQGFIDEKK